MPEGLVVQSRENIKSEQGELCNISMNEMTLKLCYQKFAASLSLPTDLYFEELMGQF